MIREDLSGLISAANEITNEIRGNFSGLNARQLNWKPSADQWSVGQCFDHLAATARAYFPIFERVLSGEKKNTLLERVPFLPFLWGQMLIKAVDPKSKYRVRAPKVFQPTSSGVDGAVVPRFIHHQNQLIRYMKCTEHLEIERIVISSPATNLVTYSLKDSYRIIISHEKRHLVQAKRVLAMAGFPRANAQNI